MFDFKTMKIPRFLGLDLQTNTVDIPNGVSLDCNNVYQNLNGTISKRKGYAKAFEIFESTGGIDELGSIVVNGQRYYFCFSDGDFKFAIGVGTAFSTISLTPTYDLGNQIFWAIADSKVFFVDGTNPLRYIQFQPVPEVKLANIPLRTLSPPTLVTGAGATPHLYKYTVSNANGESPAYGSITSNAVAGTSVVRIPALYNPAETLVAGNVVKIYASLATVASTSILVATYTWTAINVSSGFADISTSAINDLSPQLYTELGIAPQITAPMGLTGLTTHYGRLVAWKGSKVYNAFYDNPCSWPSETAINQAFVYGFALGDEDITCCVSYQESLFVMKPSRIAIFGGLGPDNTGGSAYSFNRLETNGIGCIAPKSAKVVGDEGVTQLVFLSSQGFYSTTGSKPIRIGQKIQPKIQNASPVDLKVAVAYYNKSIGHYVCTVGRNSTCVLDLRNQLDEDKAEQILYGWYLWSDIETRCYHYDSELNRVLYGHATFGIILISKADNNVTDYRHSTFVKGVLTETFIAPNIVSEIPDGYPLATPISFSDTPPTGLTAQVIYYLIPLPSGKYNLASSVQNAKDSVVLNFPPATNVVDFYVQIFAPISCFYTTNWINFKTSALVKKLLPPTIILFPETQGTVTDANVTMETAIDWVEEWKDKKYINLGSGNLWGQLPWGQFLWGATGSAHPRKVDTAYRKIRSIRYKFENTNPDEGFNLLSLEQEFDYIRNRANYYTQTGST